MERKEAALLVEVRLWGDRRLGLLKKLFGAFLVVSRGSLRIVLSAFLWFLEVPVVSGKTLKFFSEG